MGGGYTLPGLMSKLLDMIGIEEAEKQPSPQEYEDYERDDYNTGHDERRSRFDNRRRDDRRRDERYGGDRYGGEERAPFSREREPYETDRSRKKGGGKVVNHPSADMGQQHQMRIYQMEDYDDARSVIDDLLDDRSVLINLELVDVDISQRIVDMLSGATYALGASLKKAAANTYLLAPRSVEISGSYNEEENRRRSGSFFGGGRR